MKAPDNRTPEQMNWVDYFDSLSDEYFLARAQSQRPFQTPRHIPDPATVTPSGQGATPKST
jgi:hypothetical protein